MSPFPRRRAATPPPPAASEPVAPSVPQEPPKAAEAAPEGPEAPVLPFAEAQAVRLLYRLAGVLNRSDLSLITWRYVHDVLEMLLTHVKMTLATMPQDDQAHSPLTGPIPMQEIKEKTKDLVLYRPETE